MGLQLPKIPQLNFLVSRDACKIVPILREHNRADIPTCARVEVDLVCRGSDVPDTNCAIGQAGGEQCAVGVKLHRLVRHAVRICLPRERLRRFDIVKCPARVKRAREKVLLGGMERAPGDFLRMCADGSLFLERALARLLPYSDGGICASCYDQLASRLNTEVRYRLWMCLERLVDLTVHVHDRDRPRNIRTDDDLVVCVRSLAGSHGRDCRALLAKRCFLPKLLYISWL
mmetsp:Transcript_4509/g.13675  ORF Transcript_4509/g.13675 Transcript_4509/m.13675 type:complete len:230 (+) Transcript_4509:386-1075(+)